MSGRSFSPRRYGRSEDSPIVIDMVDVDDYGQAPQSNPISHSNRTSPRNFSHRRHFMMGEFEEADHRQHEPKQKVYRLDDEEVFHFDYGAYKVETRNESPDENSEYLRSSPIPPRTQNTLFFPAVDRNQGLALGHSASTSPRKKPLNGGVYGDAFGREETLSVDVDMHQEDVLSDYNQYQTPTEGGTAFTFDGQSPTAIGMTSPGFQYSNESDQRAAQDSPSKKNFFFDIDEMSQRILKDEDDTSQPVIRRVNSGVSKRTSKSKSSIVHMELNGRRTPVIQLDNDSDDEGLNGDPRRRTLPGQKRLESPKTMVFGLDRDKPTGPKLPSPRNTPRRDLDLRRKMLLGDGVQDREPPPTAQSPALLKRTESKDKDKTRGRPAKAASLRSNETSILHTSEDMEMKKISDEYQRLVSLARNDLSKAARHGADFRSQSPSISVSETEMKSIAEEYERLVLLTRNDVNRRLGIPTLTAPRVQSTDSTSDPKGILPRRRSDSKGRVKQKSLIRENESSPIPAKTSMEKKASKKEVPRDTQEGGIEPPAVKNGTPTKTTKVLRRTSGSPQRNSSPQRKSESPRRKSTVKREAPEVRVNIQDQKQVTAPVLEAKTKKKENGLDSESQSERVHNASGLSQPDPISDHEAQRKPDPIEAQSGPKSPKALVPKVPKEAVKVAKKTPVKVERKDEALFTQENERISGRKSMIDGMGAQSELPDVQMDNHITEDGNNHNPKADADWAVATKKDEEYQNAFVTSTKDDATEMQKETNDEIAIGEKPGEQRGHAAFEVHQAQSLSKSSVESESKEIARKSLLDEDRHVDSQSFAKPSPTDSGHGITQDLNDEGQEIKNNVPTIVLDEEPLPLIHVSSDMLDERIPRLEPTGVKGAGSEHTMRSARTRAIRGDIEDIRESVIEKQLQEVVRLEDAVGAGDAVEIDKNNDKVDTEQGKRMEQDKPAPFAQASEEVVCHLESQDSEDEPVTEPKSRSDVDDFDGVNGNPNALEKLKNATKVAVQQKGEVNPPSVKREVSKKSRREVDKRKEDSKHSQREGTKSTPRARDDLKPKQSQSEDAKRSHREREDTKTNTKTSRKAGAKASRREDPQSLRRDVEKLLMGQGEQTSKSGDPKISNKYADAVNGLKSIEQPSTNQPAISSEDVPAKVGYNFDRAISISSGSSRFVASEDLSSDALSISSDYSDVSSYSVSMSGSSSDYSNYDGSIVDSDEDDSDLEESEDDFTDNIISSYLSSTFGWFEEKHQELVCGFRTDGAPSLLRESMTRAAAPLDVKKAKRVKKLQALRKTIGPSYSRDTSAASVTNSILANDVASMKIELPASPSDGHANTLSVGISQPDGGGESQSSIGKAGMTDESEKKTERSTGEAEPDQEAPEQPERIVKKKKEEEQSTPEESIKPNSVASAVANAVDMILDKKFKVESSFDKLDEINIEKRAEALVEKKVESKTKEDCDNVADEIEIKKNETEGTDPDRQDDIPSKPAAVEGKERGPASKQGAMPAEAGKEALYNLSLSTDEDEIATKDGKSKESVVPLSPGSSVSNIASAPVLERAIMQINATRRHEFEDEFDFLKEGSPELVDAKIAAVRASVEAVTKVTKKENSSRSESKKEDVSRHSRSKRGKSSRHSRSLRKEAKSPGSNARERSATRVPRNHSTRSSRTKGASATPSSRKSARSTDQASSKKHSSAQKGHTSEHRSRSRSKGAKDHRDDSDSHSQNSASEAERESAIKERRRAAALKRRRKLRERRRAKLEQTMTDETMN